MRHMLASVILRLLGSRVVHEDADLSFYPMQSFQFKREMESPPENSSVPSTDLSGESLFDRLLLVLHGLLSNCQPSWLRSKPASKSSNLSKDSFGFDREMVESLQVWALSKYLVYGYYSSYFVDLAIFWWYIMILPRSKHCTHFA